MRLYATLAILLGLTPAALAVATVQFQKLADLPRELDGLYTGPNVSLKAALTSADPANSDLFAQLLEDVRLAALADRVPASSQKRVPERPSGLPNSIKNGFEYSVRSKKQVTKFWVVKRKERYDLLFVNSSGSKASLALSPENFSYLLSQARAVAREVASVGPTPRNCPHDGTIRVHYVENGRAQKSATACVSDKTKPAEHLRILGNLLATLVR